VQPLAAGRQLVGFGWEARRDEPGREGTLQHGGTNKIVRRLYFTIKSPLFCLGSSRSWRVGGEGGCDKSRPVGGWLPGGSGRLRDPRLA
jgi:hypothetical protein